MSSSEPIDRSLLEGLQSQDKNLSALQIKAKKAAKEFEAIFLQQILKQTNSKMTKGLFGGGMGEKMFQDYVIEERARLMSESGGVGLAKVIEEEILGSHGKKLKNSADASENTAMGELKLNIKRSAAKKTY